MSVGHDQEIFRMGKLKASILS